MRFNVAAFVGLLATTVVADGASIIGALNSISAGNAALNNSVLSWDGSLTGSVGILGKTMDLEKAINAGTTAANASAELTTDESVQVYTIVLGLSKDVDITINTLIAAKPKFDNASITPIVAYEIGVSKTDTDEFGAAVVAKVPAALQDVAKQTVAMIDASFQRAVDAYKLF